MDQTWLENVPYQSDMYMNHSFWNEEGVDPMTSPTKPTPEINAINSGGKGRGGPCKTVRVLPTQPTSENNPEGRQKTQPVPVKYLMDSGSELNTISKAGLDKFRPQPPMSSPSVSAKAVNGTKLRFNGQIIANVQLDNKTVPVTLQVSENTSSSIIWIPGLFELNVSATPDGGLLHLEKYHGYSAVHTRVETVITPFSTRRVQIVDKGREAGKDGSGEEDDDGRPVIAMARPSLSNAPRIVAGVYTAKDNRISVLMANPTQQPFNIKPNVFVGVIDELDENLSRPWAPETPDHPLDAKRTPWIMDDSEQQFQNFISNFNLHHIKPPDRRILEKLLWEKRKAFAKDVAEVGLYN